MVGAAVGGEVGLGGTGVSVGGGVSVGVGGLTLVGVGGSVGTKAMLVGTDPPAGGASTAVPVTGMRSSPI